ncbi:MAG: SIR2 family protein [bacterium]
MEDKANLSVVSSSLTPAYWDNKFQLGSRELLIEIMGPKPTEEESKTLNEKGIRDKWNEFLLQGQIYISKLLKAENLSFLFGAGPSIPLGAVTIRNIPLKLEYQINRAFSTDSDDIKLFYEILEHLKGSKPFRQKNVQERIETIKQLTDKGNTENIKEQEIKITLEDLLSFLYCLRSAICTPFKKQNNFLPTNIVSLNNGEKEIKVRLQVLDNLITAIKREYFSLLSKVPDPSIKNPLTAHKQFLKKILTRPLNLRRPKIFTTNNDLLIEQAMDELGIMYLDGFVGTIRRAFRPECYNYDFYFPSTSTEGKVHRIDQVIHFYKIHGSINWVTSFDSPENIYGIETKDIKTIEKEEKYREVMIYPTPLKHEFTLDFPYSDLFRRFADAITQPQSVLVIIGYSFADEHVNRIIYQALTIPSFTLLIVDPLADKNEEIKRLITLEDSRIHVISGWDIGAFENFTKKLLPDIKELDVYEKSAKSARRMLRVKEDENFSSEEEE